MSTERKSYSEEFKREAVRLAKERGNVAATARGLGISDTSLENWKRHPEQTPDNAFPGNGNPRDNQTVQPQRELLAQKGLPPLPAIPTIPGNARWSAMIEQAHTLLSTAFQEMQDYHDDRSKQWQDSTKAEDLLARVEQLQETTAHLQGME